MFNLLSESIYFYGNARASILNSHGPIPSSWHDDKSTVATAENVPSAT